MFSRAALFGFLASAATVLANAIRSRCILSIAAYVLVHFALAPLGASAIADPAAEALIGFAEWGLLSLAVYFRAVARGPIIGPPEGGPRPRVPA